MSKPSASTNRIAQNTKAKQGVSWGVDGAVLATPAVIGSESSPTPQGASSVSSINESALIDQRKCSYRSTKVLLSINESAIIDNERAFIDQRKGYHRQRKGYHQSTKGLSSINERAIDNERAIIDQRKGFQGAGSRSLPGTAEGGGSGTDSYLELYDNVSSWLGLTCDKKGVGWFIGGECENGHRFAKELVCGKEWCSVCGEDDSVAHLRRFARWLPKTQQFEVMGYFVFTIPEALRAKYRTKRALADLGHQVQELLKSWGYYRGLRRWHFFGDRSIKWHPHLNCLVDGGFINENKLAAIKRAYASLLEADVVDVNYRYRLSPGKMVHSLKYVTRATFRDYDWDLELALELRGFRNMVVWGRGQWDGPSVWSLADLQGKVGAAVEGLDIQAIESLAAGVCPVCGEALTWSEALPVGLLNMVRDKQDLGAGYWRLPDIRPPPELPGKQKLYWMALQHRVEVQLAQERAEAEARVEAEAYQGWWADLIY